MQLKFAVLGCACAASWLSSATAQQHANANPADPQAEVQPARYQSAFTGYRPFRDEKPASWRGLNDEVARVGGHAGIFRGSAPAAQQSAAPAPATTGNPAGHHPGAAK